MNNYTAIDAGDAQNRPERTYKFDKNVRLKNTLGKNCKKIKLGKYFLKNYSEESKILKKLIKMQYGSTDNF